MPLSEWPKVSVSTRQGALELGRTRTRLRKRARSKAVQIQYHSDTVNFCRFQLGRARLKDAAVNNPRRGISKCQGSDKTRIARD